MLLLKQSEAADDLELQFKQEFERFTHDWDARMHQVQPGWRDGRDGVCSKASGRHARGPGFRTMARVGVAWPARLLHTYECTHACSQMQCAARVNLEALLDRQSAQLSGAKEKVLAASWSGRMHNAAQGCC